MGLKTKTSCYILVGLIASLAKFQMECLQEREVRRSKFGTFNPEVTECHVTLPFGESGVTSAEVHLGAFWILREGTPCALGKLYDSIFGGDNLIKDKQLANFQNITIMDARKAKPDFHKTGFTLIEIEEPITKDWRTPYINFDFLRGKIEMNAEADVVNFFNQMNPYIKKLYPNVKRTFWTTTIVRGGGKVLDHPIAAQPHIDYNQNDADRIAFHKEHPILESSYFTDEGMLDKTEPGIMMGMQDTEDSKLGAILGIWKPLSPSKICDHPMTIMDASTFEPEFHLNSNFSMKILNLLKFNNLAGGVAYSPKQKWYWYPFQTDREVLVFHQYSKGRFFANPHSSFLNTNCPKDSETRVSIEARVSLFF